MSWVGWGEEFVAVKEGGGRGGSRRARPPGIVGSRWRALWFVSR